jgi:hypothetical protein
MSGSDGESKGESQHESQGDIQGGSVVDGLTKVIMI